jgi:sarcosine oxidase subunit gamma
MMAAWSFQSVEAEKSRMADLALCDCSCLPRTSFKGPGAVAWLEGLRIAVPPNLYGYSNWNGQGLLIRVDKQEVFFEDDLQGQGVKQIVERHGAATSGVYRVERQDASFLLSGVKSTKVLLETCGYDFRAPGHSLVMTRVAGVSCAVLRLEKRTFPLFRFWLDCSYGAYLWEALHEIVHDHGGDVVGLGCHYGT